MRLQGKEKKRRVQMEMNHIFYFQFFKVDNSLRKLAIVALKNHKLQLDLFYQTKQRTWYLQRQMISFLIYFTSNLA